jgi:hypothetical protein
MQQTSVQIISIPRVSHGQNKNAIIKELNEKETQKVIY